VPGHTPLATATDDATSNAARPADRCCEFPHTVIKRTPGCSGLRMTDPTPERQNSLRNRKRAHNDTRDLRWSPNGSPVRRQGRRPRTRDALAVFLSGYDSVMERDGQPIGWWLKHLDRLIERAFDEALTEARLERRHWQILNVVARHPATRGAIADALAPFWDRADTELDPLLQDLESRGLLQQVADGRWVCTPAGTPVHAAASARVETIRGRLARGITAEEYERTIDVLSRMAANLESTPPSDS
jgi:DNA-binding MarR family transcriptional regulator